MTAKRDSKSKPKKAERPKIKKEKLRDLDPKGEGVTGGRPIVSKGCETHSCQAGGCAGD